MWMRHVTNTWMKYAINTIHKYYVWINYITHVNETCHKYVNATCHKYPHEWDMSQIRYTNTCLIHLSVSTNLWHASFTWVIGWLIDRIYHIGVYMNQSYPHVSFTWATWLIHIRHGTCFIHPFEWDMSLKRPIWTTWHMNQSCHPSCDWNMSQTSAVTETCHKQLLWLRHVTNKCCDSYERGMPHVCMQHVGIVWMSHVTHA